jgi:hypothetical protein
MDPGGTFSTTGWPILGVLRPISSKETQPEVNKVIAIITAIAGIGVNLI